MIKVYEMTNSINVSENQTCIINKRKYVLRNNHFNKKQKQLYRDKFIEYIQKNYLLDSLNDDINEYITFKSNCKYLSISIKKFNILDCALKHYILKYPIPNEFNNDTFKMYLYKSALKEYNDLQKYFKHSDNLTDLLTKLLNTCDQQLQLIIYPKSLRDNTILNKIETETQTSEIMYEDIIESNIISFETE